MFGVGFIARPGGGLGFSAIRAVLVDLPCGAGLELAAAQGQHAYPLPFAATALLEPMFQTITRVELRRILAEIALVGQVPPEQLAAVPRSTLEGAVASMGVPLQLSALYPE